MKEYSFQRGSVETPGGSVPRVVSELTGRDRFGSFRARMGIGRMRYRVKHGLYAVGNPTPESPVFVSANYKMSFDRLRENLSGRDSWILVLDTHGINVWCAAGKGTFGTDEVVRRVEDAGLAGIVRHRRLIVPQLGAVGVNAHEVYTRCGFKVTYGPIRAPDIARFMDSEMKATPEMRRVSFSIRERLVLIPMEVLAWAKYAILIAALLIVLGGIGGGGFTSAGVANFGIKGAAIFLGAYLLGAVASPLLLPWLPGRAFALKGLWIGLAAIAGLIAYQLIAHAPFANWFQLAAWILLVPATTSFMAMNFTGASTYTSISGVRREMKFAVPIQLVCVIAGLALWVVGLIIE